MSLIAIAHGLVVCDSARWTSDGMIFKSGKVFPYTKPVRMWSKRHKFRDLFYGFSGTGEDAVIEFAGNVAKAGQLDLLFDRYRHADEMRLITGITHFTLVLYGLNGTAYLKVNPGSISLEYTSYGGGAGHIAFGSGAEAFTQTFAAYDDNLCPLTASYLVTLMEPTVGGAMEVWSLPTAAKGPGAKLIKLGSYPALTMPQVIKLASKPKNKPFIEECQTWLLTYLPRLPKSLLKRLTGKTTPPSREMLDSPRRSSKKPSKVASSRPSRKSRTSPKPPAPSPSP